MKKIIAVVASALIPALVQSQGIITYISSLDQAPASSLSVGSNSWLATTFVTGANTGGYLLNSVQLGISNAFGNPSDFSVSIYSHLQGGPLLSQYLGNLSGPTNPSIAGIYAYSPISSLILSAHTQYVIVLTDGKASADGTYEWNTVSNPLVPNGGWIENNNLFTSINGISWPGGGTLANTYAQFALNATAVPEPGSLALLSLGALGLSLRGWKKTRP